MGRISGGLCTLTAALCLTGVQAAQADTVYSNISSWYASGQPETGELNPGYWYCPTCTTIAETFVAPAGGLSLNSFSFQLAPNDPIFRMELTPFVFAWSGDVQPGGITTAGGAVGSDLLSPSQPRIDFSSSEVGANPPFGTQVFTGTYGQFTEVTANLLPEGGVTLVAGQTYVLGLTLAGPNYGNNLNGAAIGSIGLNQIIPGSNDGGGVGVMPNDGNDLAALTSQPWWDYVNGSPVAGNAAPPTGQFAYSADFGPVPSNLTLTGTIYAGAQDLQYKDLVYYLSDGTNSYSGETLLDGTCTAGQPGGCAFSESVYMPLGFTPTSVSYTILGFYGNNAPGNCGAPPCTVSYLPDVFALTDSSFPAYAFSAVGDGFWNLWGYYGSFSWGWQFEDAVATAMYNGETLASQGLLPSTPPYYLLSSAGGALNGTLNGSIYDFSSPTLNGSFQLTDSLTEGSSTPEPSTTAAMLAGLLVLLLAARWGRRSVCVVCQPVSCWQGRKSVHVRH
jgi:hypothetical protein